jgi:hypothetical protein
LAEHRSPKPGAAGSIPVSPAIIKTTNHANGVVFAFQDSMQPGASICENTKPTLISAGFVVCFREILNLDNLNDY